MITFAFPWILGAAIACVLAVAAVHLLSVRKPPSLLLPTARFLPDREVRAISRTKRPSDVWLMLLRMLALLLAGLAASGVSWQSGASSRAVVIVSTEEIARDTAAATTLLQASEDDPLAVVFLADQRGRVALQAAQQPGAVFPAALREAALIAARHASIDSIELHILTSRRSVVDDAGWRVWRAAWPGQVTVHHAPDSGRDTDVGRNRRVVLLRATSTANSAGDDPVMSALEWHGAQHAAADARIIDTVMLLRDSLETSLPNHGVTIRWPRSGVPAGWRAIPLSATRTDSALALVSGGQAMMAPWRVPADAPTSSLASKPTTLAVANAEQRSASHPIAWWSDGRIAATETRAANGCVRDVAALVDAASDVLLSSSASGLFQQLLAPCMAIDSVPVSALTVRTTDGPSAADADRFRNSEGQQSATGTTTRLVHAVLLAVALAMLVIESLLRARSRMVAA